MFVHPLFVCHARATFPGFRNSVECRLLTNNQKLLELQNQLVAPSSYDNGDMKVTIQFCLNMTMKVILVTVKRNIKGNKCSYNWE